jgi:hypothetical protein
MGKIQGTDLELLGVSSINDVPIEQLGGSGDGSNYLTTGKTGNTIADVNIWQGYENTVNGVNPDKASGGTSLLAVSLNTTNPISGNGDIRFTKPASNIQGDGRALPFSIENRHLARVIQITVDARLQSGTYVTGDLRLSIIQDPSGTPVLIEPVNTAIQLGIAGQTVKLIATFQTHITIKDYALCVHVASTSALAYTVDFNNFKVWEPIANYGAIITDWTQHILTSSNTQGIGTPYASPSQNVRWRRVGSNLEMRGNFRLGTTTASEFRVNFPNGLDANITPTTDRNDSEVIGYLAIDSTSQTANRTLHTKNGFGYFNVGIQRSDVTSNPLSANNGDSISSDQDVTFYLSVPIAGWGSNMALSSDAGDGRLVDVYLSGMTSSAVSTTAGFKWTTVVRDSHGAVNNAGSETIFTAPFSALYIISGTVASGSTNLWIKPRRGSTNLDPIGFHVPGTGGSISGTVFLNAGEQLKIVFDGSATTTNTANSSLYITTRVSNQIITPVETVVATATKESGSWTDLTKVTWSHKQIDTHGALNIATGDYVCPMAGKYLVTAMLRPNSYMTGSGATTSGGVDIRKNGTRESVTNFYWNGAGNILQAGEQGTRIVDCIAGDVLSIFGVGSFTVETGKFSHLSIMRIGI